MSARPRGGWPLFGGRTRIIRSRPRRSAALRRTRPPIGPIWKRRRSPGRRCRRAPGSRARRPSSSPSSLENTSPRCATGVVQLACDPWVWVWVRRGQSRPPLGVSSPGVRAGRQSGSGSAVGGRPPALLGAACTPPWHPLPHVRRGRRPGLRRLVQPDRRSALRSTSRPSTASIPRCPSSGETQPNGE